MNNREKTSIRREHYKRIVYGATFLGLGLAADDPDHTLVLESSSLAGYEFIDALAFPEGQLTTPQTRFARQLQAELTAREILVDGKIHLPNVSPALMLLIQRHSLQIIFQSRISACTAEYGTVPGKVTVTALCLNDHRTWTCDQFIDTTASIRQLKSMGVAVRSEIHALLRGSADDLQRAAKPDWVIRTGLYPQYVMLGLPLSLDDTMDHARATMLAAVGSIPSDIGLQLLSIANTPYRSLIRQVWPTGPACFLAPSCGCQDFFAALNQAGTLSGIRMDNNGGTTS